ncbi:MAG: hypothetical protein ACE5R4_18475 [Armatimonadota bacterium]
MITSTRAVTTTLAVAALVALPAGAWADGGFFFGGGFGGPGGGFFGGHGGAFGHHGGFFGPGRGFLGPRHGGAFIGDPFFGGTPFGGFGGWGYGYGLSGYGYRGVTTDQGDHWAGVRSYLRGRYTEDADMPEIGPQGPDTPVEFRARLVAPRVLEVTWPGSEEPVSQVVFELLDANGGVIDKRYEQEPPYKGFLNVTSRARSVRVTVTYEDGLERSVRVPFEPPEAQ